MFACLFAEMYIKPCGNLREVNESIDQLTSCNLKFFLINIGVNDLDTNTGDEGFKSLKSVVEKLRNRFNGIKIVLRINTKAR